MRTIQPPVELPVEGLTLEERQHLAALKQDVQQGIRGDNAHRIAQWHEWEFLRILVANGTLIP